LSHSVLLEEKLDFRRIGQKVSKNRTRDTLVNAETFGERERQISIVNHMTFPRVITPPKKPFFRFVLIFKSKEIFWPFRREKYMNREH